MFPRRLSEALFGLAALFIAQSASSAETPENLVRIVSDFRRDPTAGWERVAAFLARHGKWADAAKAQKQAVEGDAAGARLLLARYQLHAGDVAAAEETLKRLDRSRPARWLRVELHLAHDDLEAAERELDTLAGSERSPADDEAANRLYCGQALRAIDVEDVLRARLALAREDSQEVLALARTIGSRARYPDARILAAFALQQMGKPDQALEELEALGSNPIPPQTHCPGVLLDRVLFNQANIAARSGDPDRSPAELYRQAIMVAAARESAFRDAVTTADLPLESPLNAVLLPARRDPDTAAPEARNNLGQFLLKTALRTDSTSSRRRLLSEAEKAFTAAASNPHYATRQYAFAGLAKVNLVSEEPGKAIQASREALSLDPRNQDALDVAAALAHDEEAALLLVSAAREALPADYGHEEYGDVLRETLEKAKTKNSEIGDALLASVALWNGDSQTAREAIDAAKVRYPSSTWPAAFEGQLKAQTGATAEAAAILASVSDSLQRKRLSRSWEVAAIRPSSAAYSVLAARTENTEHARRAQMLVAAVTPSDGSRFPWEERRGGLFGTVTESGSTLPGVTITAVGPDGRAYTTVADGEGKYHLDLPPGAYVVTAELSGMQTVRRHEVVGPEGATVDFPIKTTVAESITVMAEAPMIDVRNTSIATSVTPEMLEALPMTRDPRAFASLILVDGVNVTDFAATSSGGALMSRDVVQEIQIMTAGPPAEYGHPSTMNVISRSGANDFSGDLYMEAEPVSFRLDTEPVSVPTALYARRDERAVKASLGGPFIRDRLWFFVSGDLRSIDGSPDEDRQAGSGTSRTNELFAKLNAQLSSSWSTVLSLNRRREGRSGVVDDVAGAAFGDPASIRRRGEHDSNTGLLSLTGIITPSIVIEMRGSAQHGERSLRPESDAGNMIQQREVLNAFFTRGGVGVIDDGRRNDRTNAMGLVTFFTGTAEIRFGGAYDSLRDRVRDRLSGGVINDVVSVEGRLRPVFRRRWLFGAAAGAVNESSESESTAAHVHSKLEVGQRLAIDAGLRWEQQLVQFPSNDRLATAVLQPRLGVVFDPSGNGRSRLSATYARYGEPLTPDELLAFGSQRRYAVEEDGYGQLDSIDPDLRGRSTDEFSASVAREFSGGPLVQISAIHRRLKSHIEDYFCTEQLTRCVGNPGRGRMGGPAARREITSVETAARDKKDVELFGNDIDLEWRVNYTWSRGTGNVEAPDVAATRVVGIDPYSRTAFDSPSLVPPDQPLARDRRHTVIGSAMLRFEQPYADGPFVLGIWVRWRSGEPLAPFAYSDLYGRYVAFLRPRGAEGRTPDVLESDLSLTYTRAIGGGSVQLGVAVANILNRQTTLTADQRWSFFEDANTRATSQNPNYLEPMTRSAPRSIRLFAKFTF